MLPSSATQSDSPTYDLADMQAKVALGYYAITASARDGAAALGFDEQDITQCVRALTPAHFYKTMPSDVVEGTFQDVYKTDWDGKAVYTKLTLGRPRRNTVVISFKLDESPHAGGDS